MCGIIGRASSAHLSKDNAWVSIGRDMMQHRGPDGSGIWASVDAKVEFGHRRLAIVDTTDFGSQPMLDSDRAISVVFNGEIYNYKQLREELIDLGYFFRSDSDTEVLIASYKEWGRDCVSKLNGMFVFALYDIRSGDVFIARDRAGEKPLYYCLNESGFSFASELKALIENKEIKRDINRSSLDCYLAFGFIPGSRCIYSAISKLEAGCWIIFNTTSGELVSCRYWTLPKSTLRSSLATSEVNQRLDHFGMIFEDSVAEQMQADVPVGVLLSGGLDSSLITAVASKFCDQLKTFSVRFPGFGKLDETEHARKVSSYFGTEHIELEANAVDPELLISLARQYDEPVIDSSMIPTYLISREVRKHCTVALGGDGADELFGGYTHYERLLKLRKATGWLPLSIRKQIVKLFSEILPDNIKGRNWLQAMKYDYETETPLIAAYFDEQSRQKLIGYHYLNECQSADEIYSELCAEGVDIIDRATRTDFLTYLVEDILVKVDRASMMNSLEMRAPFLDHRIIDFAFSQVPTELKVKGSSRKIFLNAYATRLLPSNFSFGRKQGFSIPLNDWLQKGPFKDFFYDILLASDCIFDHSYVNQILKDNGKGRNNGEKIFGILMFELWRKYYKAKL